MVLVDYEYKCTKNIQKQINLSYCSKNLIKINDTKLLLTLKLLRAIEFITNVQETN